MKQAHLYTLTKKQAYGIVGGSYGLKTLATLMLLNFPTALAVVAGVGVVAALGDQIRNGKNSYAARSVALLRRIGLRGIILPFKIVVLDIYGRGRKIAQWRPFKKQRVQVANDNGATPEAAKPAALDGCAAGQDFNAASKTAKVLPSAAPAPKPAFGTPKP